MDGLRTEVLPINRNTVTSYFVYIWEFVHSLIAPFLSLQHRQDDSEKFRSHLEAEEARLENNLKAVDYIIDGTDTLTLITGTGRIEKVSTYINSVSTTLGSNTSFRLCFHCFT